MGLLTSFSVLAGYTAIYTENFENGTNGNDFPCVFEAHAQPSAGVWKYATDASEGTLSVDQTSYTDSLCALPIRLDYMNNQYKITFDSKITRGGSGGNSNGIAMVDSNISTNYAGNYYLWNSIVSTDTEHYMYNSEGYYDGTRWDNTTSSTPPTLDNLWLKRVFYMNSTCIYEEAYYTNGSLAASIPCTTPISQVNNYYFGLWISQQGGTNNYFDNVTVFLYETIDTPPTTPLMTNISPTPAYTDSLLTWTVSNSTDIDNDPITYMCRVKDTDNLTILSDWSTDTSFNCLTTGCDKGDTMNVECYASTPKANSSSVSASKYISNYAPVPTINFPVNGSILERQLDIILNITVTDGDNESTNITFINTDTESILCQNDSIPSGTQLSCLFGLNLSSGIYYNWTLNITDGTDFVSNKYTFVPDDEPILYNMRIENITPSSALIRWQNEPNMEWVSLQVGSDLMELRTVTQVDDYWLVHVLNNYEYFLRAQSGDDFLFMSDYIIFPWRSYGWMPEMSNYSYRRLFTINHSAVSGDQANWSVNITLTDENFQYFDPSFYVYYPSFQHLNWSNHNDIRFVNYYNIVPLQFQVTSWNVPGQGGSSVQVIPDATAFTGGWIDPSFAHDDNWATQATANLTGEAYYNYTIPVGAKTTSKFRIYDGGYGWDLTLPTECYGGTNLEFKSVGDYTVPSMITYCKNQTNSNWILVRNNNDFAVTSAYLYETQMTWEYESTVTITVTPEHWDETAKANVPGIDGDYDVKFWMYYGNNGPVDNNETAITPAGLLQGNYIMGDEVGYIVQMPSISNINDTIGRTATTTNISFDVDQSTNNRIYYATNQWMLDKLPVARLINQTETFNGYSGSSEHTFALIEHPEYFMGIINVTSSNPAYSTNYTVSTTNNSVFITFLNVGDATLLDWTVTYERNFTIDWGKGHSEFMLELPTDTTYYYEIYASTDGINTTGFGSFTLGTVPAAPTVTFDSYDENRPDKQVTICVDVTDMNSEPAVNVSIQYWKDGDTTFSETDKTEVTSTGQVCKIIGVEYGNAYHYRGKAQATTTGYSDMYSNKFLAIQDFFAGSYIEDQDNNGQNLDFPQREYCPNGIGTTPCFIQYGYWEGSNQEENWIWIETDEGGTGLTLHWWDGNSWSTDAMNSDNDSTMQYIKKTGLGTAWQTFYVTNSTGVVLNWTKPSMIHPFNQNRTDESKYVSFDNVKQPVDYTLLYFDYSFYNTTAYDYCMAAPGGNLYDCMAVEYWGGGVESGIGPEMAGTAYDRGQLFRGGVINGMMADTGFLTPTLDPNREAGRWRNCFAFNDFYWNASLIPSNNITNYYYRHWTADEWFSTYFGYKQDAEFDEAYLYKFEYDQLSNTRDWKPFDGTTVHERNVKQTVGNNIFTESVSDIGTPNYGVNYDQSLVWVYKDGFNINLDGDKVWNFGLYLDGQWINEQIGKHQQGYIVFNLPDNATLQGMDSDNDGLNDYDELFVYVTNPKYNDTDDDGRTDGYEVSIGMDPNVPEPTQEISIKSPLINKIYGRDFEDVYLIWNSSVAPPYFALQYSNNSVNWNTLDTVNTSTLNKTGTLPDNYTISLIAEMGQRKDTYYGYSLSFKPNETAYITKVRVAQANYLINQYDLDTKNYVFSILDSNGNVIARSYHDTYVDAYRVDFLFNATRLYAGKQYYGIGVTLRGNGDPITWPNPWNCNIECHFWGTIVPSQDYYYVWDISPLSAGLQYSVRVTDTRENVTVTSDNFEINAIPTNASFVTPGSAYGIKSGVVSGIVHIVWNESTDLDPFHYELEFYNITKGDYSPIANISNGTNYYDWDTSNLNLIDNYGYTLRIRTKEDITSGVEVYPYSLITEYQGTPYTFTINSIPQTSPTILVSGNSVMKGDYLNITWNTSRTSQTEPVTYSIYLSNDSGTTWQLLNRSADQLSFKTDLDAGTPQFMEPPTSYAVTCNDYGYSLIEFFPTRNMYITEAHGESWAFASQAVRGIIYDENLNWVTNTTNAAWGYGSFGTKFIFTGSQRVLLHAGQKYYYQAQMSNGYGFCNRNNQPPVNQTWLRANRYGGNEEPNYFYIQGIEADYMVYQYNTSDLTPQTYLFKVESTDGNYNLSSEGNFTLIDNTPPVITGIEILNQTAYTDTNLVAECNITDDGKMQPLEITYDWYKNNISLGINETTLSGSNFDKNDIIVFSCSAYDGMYTTSENSTEINILNSAPTTPVITNPVNGSTYGTSTIAVMYNSSDADSDTIYYEVYLDSNPNPTTLVQNSTLSLYLFSGSDGTYYVKVIAYDGTQQSDYSPITHFTKNMVAPAIALASPLNNAQITGSGFTIWYTATSPYLIQSCKVVIKGIDYLVDPIVYSGVQRNITVPLTDGVYDWRIKCTDSNALVAYSELRYIYMIKPEVGSTNAGGTENTKETQVVTPAPVINETKQAQTPQTVIEQLQSQVPVQRSKIMETLTNIFDRIQETWGKIPLLKSLDFKQTFLATTIVVLVWQFIYRTPVKRKIT